MKVSAAIVGLAIIISAAVFGGSYYEAQTQSSANKDALSVTGSAKMRVTSDQAKLVIALNREVAVTDLSTGYSSIAHDLGLTRDLLQKSGATGASESPVSMNQTYNPNSTESRYQLSQTITLQSNDVNKLTDISKKIPDLASQGAIVSVQSLEYYYSKLPDLRVSLLTQATQDAKARAEKIAAGTGRHVGSVQSASSGVVQVLAPDSVAIDDYGNYDTSSIEKDVMVTVKASFRLE